MKGEAPFQGWMKIEGESNKGEWRVKHPFKGEWESRMNKIKGE